MHFLLGRLVSAMMSLGELSEFICLANKYINKNRECNKFTCACLEVLIELAREKIDTEFEKLYDHCRSYGLSCTSTGEAHTFVILDEFSDFTLEKWRQYERIIKKQ